MLEYQTIIDALVKNNQTIATMESCTGGAVASEITNHPGASEVLKFSAVTYSNEYKIKMGVKQEIIEEYSVYSIETAMEMAKNIAKFAESDYGIGVTGKINRPDAANQTGANDEIFIAIYEAKTETYHQLKIEAKKDKTRKENKEYIVSYIGKQLVNLIEK